MPEDDELIENQIEQEADQEEKKSKKNC